MTVPTIEFDSTSGVVIPETADIREGVAEGFQAAFQTSADDPVLNTEASTPAGQVVDLVVGEIEAKNSEVAFMANMTSPLLATGVFLDAIASLYGLERKLSEPTVVTCQLTGLKGTVIPYGAIAQDTEGNQLRHSAVAGCTIGDDGTGETTFSTIEHGDIEIAAGTVTQIVTVVAGWDSITNEAAGATGRVEETDAELRNRITESYAINSTGTASAIYANLAELDGVLDVVVLENYTSSTVTQYSVEIEAHSICVCIVGGEDDAIAEVIYQRKDVGCGTSGDYEVTYTDEDTSATYTYNIIRPTSTAFRIQVTFIDDTMAEDQQAEVKTALISDFNGELENSRVSLASTVYASRFYSAVMNAASGYGLVSIYVALGDDADWALSATIPADEEPTLDEDDVELIFGGGS